MTAREARLGSARAAEGSFLSRPARATRGTFPPGEFQTRSAAAGAQTRRVLEEKQAARGAFYCQQASICLPDDLRFPTLLIHMKPELPRHQWDTDRSRQLTAPAPENKTTINSLISLLLYFTSGVIKLSQCNNSAGVTDYTSRWWIRDFYSLPGPPPALCVCVCAGAGRWAHITHL